MPVDMKALLARERERRRAAASGEPAGAATTSSSAAATAPVVMAPRAKTSLRDFDVGERAGVRGLHYVPDFISPDEERAVLAGIHAPGTESRWVRSGRRRVANYGGVPSSSEVTEPLPPFADVPSSKPSRRRHRGRAHRAEPRARQRVRRPRGHLTAQRRRRVRPARRHRHPAGRRAPWTFVPKQPDPPPPTTTAADCDEREPTPIAQVLLRPRSLLLYTGDAYGLRHGIRHARRRRVTDRCVNAAESRVRNGEGAGAGQVLGGVRSQRARLGRRGREHGSASHEGWRQDG